jgi:pSer/pThr/pTyr-binding forkhead associated (FHA) protein
MAGKESESRVVQPIGVQVKAPVRAWLETSRAKFSVHGGCSIGRSPKNAIVLDWQKVSRRHAVINVQNVGEFWLIDLGSSNGTFLNKRRIHQPLRLSDRDQIVIDDIVFTNKES